MNIEEEKKVHKVVIIDFISGSVGGIACVYAGQPLDTIKVKMQTHSHLYSSSTNCAIKTFQKEGFKGFYAGATPAVVANIAENSFLFLSYGQCRSAVQYLTGRKESELTIFHGACAGSLASFFAAFALCPPELIKCKLQTLREQRGKQRISLYHMIKTILKQDGVLGFYRGLTPLLMREIPANFFLFGGYESTKKLLITTEEEMKKPAAWKVIVAGGVGGVSFWLPTYPVDVIKSKLQVSEVKSLSVVATVKLMLKHEGIRSFYKGLGPTLLRAFPANAALFVAYETTKQILWKYSP